MANIHVELSILDDSGKPTLAKPHTGDAKGYWRGEYKAFLTFQFPSSRLTVPANSRSRFTATDKLGNKPAVTQDLDSNVTDVK